MSTRVELPPSRVFVVNDFLKAYGYNFRARGFRIYGGNLPPVEVWSIFRAGGDEIGSVNFPVQEITPRDISMLIINEIEKWRKSIR